jgi:serine/threonine protein kinase
MSTFEWNNYIINKPSIGKGSYSKVYSGYHKLTKLNIALKKIEFTKLHSCIKDKVISEINILQNMNHPNIIKLYEYKFDGDYLVLITEYCKDKDLEHWLNKNNSIDDITYVIKQTVCGIEYMHTNNILHRDIKSQNILLHNNTIKICDFGFSTIIKENNMMFNTICGTPLYMSPELLFMKPYTIKSDIWALGVLFYIIIYKTHPFGKLTSLDDYRSKINMKIYYPPIEGLNNIIDIIKLMLQSKMEERPDIMTINSMLNVKSDSSRTKDSKIIPINQSQVIDSPKIKPINQSQVIDSPKIIPINQSPMIDNNMNRINELEEEVFRLELIIKEKEKSSFTCCLDAEDNESEITGRGRTNKGYENMNIDTEYFTPPKTNSIPIPRRNNYTPSSNGSFSESNSVSSNKSSFKSSLPEKSKSFLSSSLEKFSSLFMQKK